MKDGWKIVKLEDVCDIVSGRSQKAVERDGGKYPIYGSGGIMGYASDYICEAGATIIGRKGSINNPIYVQTRFWNVDTAFGMVPKQHMNSKLLYYFCLSFDFTKMNKGTTIPSLVKKDLLQISIPYHSSLLEQQRIVDILDAEFAKIDALKENAEKNLQNAKDLFQAVLRKELEPKEGWKTVSIGDIAELKGGKRVPKGYKLEKTPTPYPYIRVADFNNNGSVDLDDIHYISEEVYSGIKRYIITTNDVYISIAGTIGKSGIIPKELNGANLTENACRLVFKEDINPKYVYYCTLNPDFKEQIAKLTMQAAQPKLALTRLATAVCNIPPRKDQDKIVDIISTVQNNITILCNNYIETLTLCDDLKQALLRKAFNGEL